MISLNNAYRVNNIDLNCHLFCTQDIHILGMKIFVFSKELNLHFHLLREIKINSSIFTLSKDEYGICRFYLFICSIYSP